MTFTVYNTSNAHIVNGVKFMMYGEPDSGKTTLLTTLPKPLIIATEEGLSSIKNSGIPYIIVNCMADIEPAIKWLEDDKNTKNYESVALDSISYITYKVLSEIQAKRPDLKEPRQWYGELDRTIKPLIMCILNLRKHVCITAWRGEQISKIGSRFERYIPDAAGQAIMKYLLHFFDVTANLAKHEITQYHLDPATGQPYVDANGNMYPITDEKTGAIQTVTQRFLQTREGNSTFARTRHTFLADYEPADLGALIHKIATGANQA